MTFSDKFVTELNVTSCTKYINTARFLIGCDTGEIMHQSISKACTPRAFKLTTLHFALSGINMPTCIDISPLLGNLMIAGYSSGDIAIYNGTKASSCLKWALPHEITMVRWSKQRHAVFFALDIQGIVHVFDLLKDVSGPVKNSDLWNEKVSHFELSVDSNVLYVASKTGAVNMHEIVKELAQAGIDEANEVLEIINT